MAVFNAQKHKTYWLRCLKTFLPWQYTSMDTNRIMLAFFTISALDILDVLDTSVSHGERAEYINWIYSLQHSDGGFRGSPSLSLDGLKDEEQRRKWDRASIPATYFALATLLILRDDFSRVKRDITLKWVKKMQRSDGSFGERLGSNDEVDGGHDTRFGYVAMGIRWMLAGDRSSCKDGDNDVNTDALVKNIGALQTYDGGFADLPFHEAHGGYTYCAVSALAILGRLHDGVAERESLVRWLVARQTRNLDPEDESEEDLTARFASSEPIGFNGRCNKIGDTCYTFWVAGALKIIGHLDLIDKRAAIEYLSESTQHFIGGFTKYPGDAPDIYHSYLGLAALGILELKDLKAVHPIASFSMDAVNHLEETIRPKYRL